MRSFAFAAIACVVLVGACDGHLASVTQDAAPSDDSGLDAFLESDSMSSDSGYDGEIIPVPDAMDTSDVIADRSPPTKCSGSICTNDSGGCYDAPCFDDAGPGCCDGLICYDGFCRACLNTNEQCRSESQCCPGLRCLPDVGAKSCGP